MHRLLTASAKSLVFGDGASVAAEQQLRLCAIETATFELQRAQPQLSKALRTLEYPHDLLDAKFVVEEDDSETLTAATRASADGFFDVIVVPRGAPQTKPRACNYALQFARGEYLVIFDAEDRP